MGKLITATLAALAFLAIVPTAQARTRAIDGQCGLHIVGIVIPTNNEWHVRIGPKHPGGRLHCHGYEMAKHPRGAATNTLIPSWVPFGCQVCADVYGWNWKGILGTGAQASLSSLSCASFGRTFILKLPLTLWTGVSSTVSAYGCIRGWKAVYDKVQGVNHVFTIKGFHGS